MMDNNIATTYLGIRFITGYEPAFYSRRAVDKRKVISQELNMPSKTTLHETEPFYLPKISPSPLRNILASKMKLCIKYVDTPRRLQPDETRHEKTYAAALKFGAAQSDPLTLMTQFG